MRFLKVITSGLAVVFSLVAGVVATAFIALAGIAIVVIAKVLGRRKKQVNHASRRSEIRRAAAAAGDVIDIAATEVPAERPAR